VSTVYHGSVPHDVTPLDVLWLARALDGEGGDERAVAATLVQRWVMLGGIERMSLGDMAQAYCQAISPLWLAGGARCRRGGSGHGTPACSASRTAARARRRARPWGELRQDARDAAVWALYTDELPSYLPTSVHYATRALVARKMRSREARREGWQLIEDGPPDGHSYLSTTYSREDTTPLQVRPGDLSELDQLSTLRTPPRVAPRAPERIETTDAGGGGELIALAGVGLALALAAGRRREVARV